MDATFWNKMLHHFLYNAWIHNKIWNKNIQQKMWLSIYLITFFYKYINHIHISVLSLWYDIFWLCYNIWQFLCSLSVHIKFHKELLRLTLWCSLYYLSLVSLLSGCIFNITDSALFTEERSTNSNTLSWIQWKRKRKNWY